MLAGKHAYEALQAAHQSQLPSHGCCSLFLQPSSCKCCSTVHTLAAEACASPGWVCKVRKVRKYPLMLSQMMQCKAVQAWTSDSPLDRTRDQIDSTKPNYWRSAEMALPSVQVSKLFPHGSKPPLGRTKVWLEHPRAEPPQQLILGRHAANTPATPDCWHLPTYECPACSRQSALLTSSGFGVPPEVS